MVQTDQESGLKSLGYSGLIPIMVKAMQELTEENNQLKNDVAEQNEAILFLRSENREIKLQLENLQSLKTEINELKKMVLKDQE